VSNQKDDLKQKLRSKSSTYELLIDAVSKPVERNAEHEVQEWGRPRKKKFVERHTPQTFYIENEILTELRRLAGTEKGEKTRIVNEALKQYFQSLNFPE
jgi:uncharacterized protein (DUF4415 family)